MWALVLEVVCHGVFMGLYGFRIRGLPRSPGLPAIRLVP